MRSFRWVTRGVGEPLAREDVDIGAPDSGEVIVAVSGCGVCHTDIDYHFNGVKTNHSLPLTLGHEISGRVVECGYESKEWHGLAIIIPAVLPCGECDLCRRGRGSICRAQKMPGNHIHGGFASHIKMPARGLCAVDEKQLAMANLGLEEVSVVADAVTSPYQAAVRAGIGPGDLVVVLGAGGIGSFAAQVAHALGATVVVISRSHERLELLRTRGVALALNTAEFKSTRDIKQAILSFAKQNMLRSTEWVVMECAGSIGSQELAFELLVPGATLCVIGYNMQKGTFRLSNLMALDARALGTWGCQPDLYPEALALVLTGKIAIRDFVELHPLDSINHVFESVRRHELVRRAVLVPVSREVP